MSERFGGLLVIASLGAFITACVLAMRCTASDQMGACAAMCGPRGVQVFHLERGYNVDPPGCLCVSTTSSIDAGAI